MSLFGSSTNPTSGLFSNLNAKNLPSSTGTLFGGLSSANTNPTSGIGSVFGGSGTQSTNPTSGGLFGGITTTSTNPIGGSQSGGLGLPTTTNPTSGGLFGNSSATPTTSSTNPTTGGLLSGIGVSTTTNPTSGGLFGGSTTTSTNPTTGGLFGGSTTNPTTGGVFGGLGISTTTNPTTSGGLFGGTTTTTNPTTSGGLFGGTTTTTNPTTSGGLFGGLGGTTTSNPTSGGLFGGLGGTTTTTNPTSGGLFGGLGGTTSNHTSGGLFGGLGGSSLTNQTGSIFTSGQGSTGNNPINQPGNIIGSFPQVNGNILAPFSTYISPDNQNQRYKEFFTEEINQIILNFNYTIDTRSPFNRFQQFFYNRIPKPQGNVNLLDYLYQFQAYQQIIKGEDGKDTFYNKSLHSKALEKNPDTRKYYAVPICSPDQLNIRYKTCSLIQLSTIKSILDLKQQYIKLSDKFTKSIQEELTTCQAKKEQIKDKIIRVLSKSEKVAILVNRAERDYSKENKLKYALDNIRSNLLKENLKERVNDLSHNYQNYSIISSYRMENHMNKQEISNKKVEYYKGCVSELKKMSDNLMKTMLENQNEIDFMKRDIEHLQYYGKVKIIE